jgi:hypothetical protein
LRVKKGKQLFWISIGAVKYTRWSMYGPSLVSNMLSCYFYFSNTIHVSLFLVINCCFCLPMAELVYLTLFTVLSGAPNTQSARLMPKYCFLVEHVCCIRHIPQYRLTPVEYRKLKPPSSYQLHHLVPRHIFQVVKNPPWLGFEPETYRTNVRRSNHYTIKLL